MFYHELLMLFSEHFDETYEKMKGILRPVYPDAAMMTLLIL
jgi:hypothetical protein